MQTHIINPFYAARADHAALVPSHNVSKPIYAQLPLAPRNASPVPHLTSLYHFDDTGAHRNRSYPGKCGSNLIKDLLIYFSPGLVLDPMSGSGTCQRVCDELGVACMSWDIHHGIDACDKRGFSADGMFDLIWCHAPYWRQKLYSADPRDLSRAATLDDFLHRYRQFIRNCTGALKPGGKLVILMGDYWDPEEGFVSLTYFTKRFAFECKIRQHCTDIIRFSHGASSSKKVYQSVFIPGLHEVCMVFEKVPPRAELT